VISDYPFDPGIEGNKNAVNQLYCFFTILVYTRQRNNCNYFVVGKYGNGNNFVRDKFAADSVKNKARIPGNILYVLYFGLSQHGTEFAFEPVGGKRLTGIVVDSY